MTFKSAAVVILLMSLFQTAAATEGWSVGLGVVTSDNYPEQEETSAFFPSVDVGSKTAMLIPDLKYQWSQWSVGTSGVSWQSKPDSSLKTQVTLGFPQSNLSISGQQGWFRYGVYGGAQFTNGTRVNAGVQAGPLSLEHHASVASATPASKNVVALAAPVFIGKKLPLTVIGKLSVDFSDAAFKSQSLKLSQDLPAGNYTDVSANFFAISPFNESVTLINSLTFSMADESQLNLVAGLKPVHVNIFSLISYSF